MIGAEATTVTLHGLRSPGLAVPKCAAVTAMAPTEGRKRIVTFAGYSAQMNALPAWLDEDERRSERRPVRLCVNVEYRGTGPILADMTDLTEWGCRLQLVEHIPVGQCLTVTVGRKTKLRGWVAWSKGREHGFDFAHPLKQLAVTTLQRSYASI